MRCQSHKGRSLRRDKRGSVLVEVALTLPLLITLFAGGYEMSRFALLEMKISRVAMTLGDLASQQKQSISSNDIAGFIDAVSYIGDPFTFDNTNMQVIITAVKANASDVPKVCWQVNQMGSLGKTTSVGSHNATATLPQNASLLAGDTVIVVEVFYNYAPTLFDTFIQARTLSDIALFRPRLATLETLLPSNTTCT